MRCLEKNKATDSGDCPRSTAAPVFWSCKAASKRLRPALRVPLSASAIQFKSRCIFKRSLSDDAILTRIEICSLDFEILGGQKTHL
jgi:hypothetical protein